MEGNTLVFVSSQAAFGLSKPLLSPENLYTEINERVGGIFGDSPDITPVPLVSNDRELLDAPVVQALSLDGRYQLNIARGRVDFFRNANINEKTFKSTKTDFVAKIEQISDVIFPKYDAKWFGLVFAYVYTNSDFNVSSQKFINKKLLDINSGDTHSFFLRNTNRVKVNDTVSNNLVAIGSGQVNKDNQGLVDGLLINQDFNTKPSDVIIDKDFIKSYINSAEKMAKVEDIISLV